MRHNTLRSLTLSIFVAPLALASAANGDPFDLCIKAKTAFEKIELCTMVVLQSRRPKQLERAYLRRGNAYMEINRFSDAVNDFTAVIRINPTTAGYYDNRQNALKSLGRLKDALNDANAAVRLAPGHSFVYHSRGGVYDAMGHYGFAVADFDKALSIDPNDAGLHFDRGKVLVKAGRIQEAITDFSRALDMDKTDRSPARTRTRLQVDRRL